jgi:hypothetical protein
MQLSLETCVVVYYIMSCHFDLFLLPIIGLDSAALKVKLNAHSHMFLDGIAHAQW